MEKLARQYLGSQQLEEAVECAGHYARISQWPLHGVRLAAGSGAIREEQNVLALDKGIQWGPHGLFKHLALASELCEHLEQ